MCGIAGFVTDSVPSEPATVLQRMTEAIAHRGPDDSGFYLGPTAYLGARRLSIIDLPAGHQPMSNEDGSLWVVYNGEIFNHAALRASLARAGHQYATACDTETVLHAYEEYGQDCVSRFRGMFSFALWNARTRTLFCARDRVGIKPFYYYWDGRVFAFGSEIKALLRYPTVSPALEESVLPEYLVFGYVSEERTLFARIRKLLPGHHLVLQFRDGQPDLEVRRYWDLPQAVQPEERDDRSWTEECRQRLEETVRMRLMSDVPLGVFLSGGLDSSAIAVLMQRMLPHPIQSFAVGYPEAECSELGYARRVAQTIGADHHEVTIGMNDFFNALPHLIWQEDEPIAWPSSVPLYFVARLAAQHVKVVLSGEGGDELFAGYSRYRLHLLNHRLAPWVPAAVRCWVRRQITASSMLSAPLRRQLQHTFLGRGKDLTSLYLDNFYGAFPGPPAAYESFFHHWNSGPHTDLLSRMLYTDQKSYLVEVLMKQDQISMACSIESRVPLLDHEFLEFAARVPSHLKLRGGQGKYILKKAVEDLLPREIVWTKKRGFPTPLRRWLLDPQAGAVFSILQDHDGLVASCMDRAAVSSLCERHQSGREDATDRIWRLLNLQLWGDIFLTGKRDRSAGLLLSGGRPL